MVAGCGNKCVKFLFFTFNFLIFVIGAAVFGVSLATLLTEAVRKFFTQLASRGQIDINFNDYVVALYILITVGAILMAVGFLGCCGACCENTCLLGMFFTFILICFVVEVAAAIYILVSKNKFKDGVSKGWKEGLVKNYYTDQDVRRFVDQIQEQFHCCGSNGCDDYNPPPASCHCDTKPPGCANYFIGVIETNINIVAAVAIAVLVIELLAMIFSCILCQAIRERVVY